MSTASAEVETLIATLQAAETQLRWLMAEALPPAAAYRVEQTSTRRALNHMASLRVDRRVDLPTGWAEYVEVDEEIDALLARLIRPEPPLEATLAAREPIPVVPPLPPELVRPEPTRAPEVRVEPARPEPEPPRPEPVAETPLRQSSGYVKFVPTEAYVPAPVAPEPEPEPVYDETYEEGYYEEGYDDGTGQPYAWSDPEWGHSDDAQSGRIDPYAETNPQASFSLHEIQPSEPAPEPAPQPLGAYAPLRGRPSDDDLLDEAVERTHAELTVDMPGNDWEEEEATQIVPARPAAAAIQLKKDGTGSIVGASSGAYDEDEPSSIITIALGDASEIGDDDVERTGTFGLARYEDEDEPEPVDEPTGPSFASLGAPVLSASEVQTLYQQATELAKRNVSQAVLLFGDVLDADPGHVEALVARGRLLLDLGDYGSAISDFLKAEARTPRDPEVQVALGDLYFARKDYRRAGTYYDAALTADPNHPTAIYRRGLSRYFRKDFGPAVEDLERARKLDPRLPSIDMYLDRARRKQL